MQCFSVSYPFVGPRTACCTLPQESKSSFGFSVILAIVGSEGRPEAPNRAVIIVPGIVGKGECLNGREDGQHAGSVKATPCVVMLFKS